MIALFILLYVAGIWLFYLKLKVKPTPVNLASCSVIGIVAVGAIVICWQFSAPTSSQLVVTRFTIQIIPQVKGPITKIEAKPNVPLTKGKDVLFEIQKDPYEYSVNQSKAAVGAAEKTVEQLQAGSRSPRPRSRRRWPAWRLPRRTSLPRKMPISGLPER